MKGRAGPLTSCEWFAISGATAMKLALKTGFYSIMHLTVAIAVTYAIMQDWRAALAVGLIEPAVQTVAYVVHDRVWARIEGRNESASAA